MKKLSRILIILAIVSAAFLGVNHSDETTTDVLSFEVANASGVYPSAYICVLDLGDNCKLYNYITILDCDETHYWELDTCPGTIMQ
jgi:hypothetical protein